MMMLQLLSRLVQSGWTPPVTLGLFILNSAIHFVPNLGLPPLLDVCMQPTMVLFHGDLARVLLSPFYHATDTHIYFNMASLVYKVRPVLHLTHCAVIISMISHHPLCLDVLKIFRECAWRNILAVSASW